MFCKAKTIKLLVAIDQQLTTDNQQPKTNNEKI